MSDLREIWAKVQEAAHREAETYIPSRYPYTYAADFLRAHTHLLPEEVPWRYRPINSRLYASFARQHWACLLGVGDAELASVLADGYLTEHGIPLAAANLERGQIVLDQVDVGSRGESR